MLVALGAVAVAAGCSRSPAPREDPIGAVTRAAGPAMHSPSRAEGRRIYLAYCAPCHGDEGRGDGQNASRLELRPPDLQTSVARLPAADIQRIVQGGTKAMGRTPLCPPLGRTLGADGVDVVVAYVRTLAREPGPAAR
jgi:mono/diheme cytochrome c family protein